MKRFNKILLLLTLIVVTVATAMVLSACGPKEYTVKFVADGKIISTQRYTEEKLEIIEPAVPEKEGYSAVWEDYMLSTGDITVNAVYTAITYSVTFKVDNEKIEEINYTVENKIVNEPTVPEKSGYIGAWEHYTLTTGNITVNAVYTIIPYTVAFKVENEIIYSLTYTIDNKTLIEPAVPEKVGYTGVWEQYTLTTGNITVNAVYTPITYAVTFKADDVVVSAQTYTVENKNITIPTVPTKIGYDAEWEPYTLTTGDVTVKAVYIAKQYWLNFNYNGATGGNDLQKVTVTYDQAIGVLPNPIKADYEFVGWYIDDTKIDLNTQWTITAENTVCEAKWTARKYVVMFVADNITVDVKEYTVEDKNLVSPQVPAKAGYTGEWQDYTLTTGNVTVNAVYTVKEYTVVFDYDGATGGNTVQTVTVTYDNPVGSLPTPTKEDHDFAGWFIDSQRVTNTTLWQWDNDSVTLIAKWHRIVNGTPGLTYDIRGDVAYCIGIGMATESDITISSSYDGVPVVAIASDAFRNNLQLNSLTIPDSVTRIENDAFINCENLKKVIIPNSLTTIGDLAFWGAYPDVIYYLGTVDDWAKINIVEHGNDFFVRAARYYYSDTEPLLNADGTAYDGNYWHYDENGEIVIWEKVS